MDKLILFLFITILSFSKSSIANDERLSTASELIENSIKFKKLSEKIKEKKLEIEKCYSQKRSGCPPRRRFISASTKQSMYASYMESWVSKTENVINTPLYKCKVSKLNFYGSLVLDTAINPDGSVNEVIVRRT